VTAQTEQEPHQTGIKKPTQWPVSLTMDDVLIIFVEMVAGAGL
jgi:hypothetical protein